MNHKYDISFWEKFLEAWLFSSHEPLSIKEMKKNIPKNIQIHEILERIKNHYEHRGIQLQEFEDCWAFRTAADVSQALGTIYEKPKALSDAMLEVLAVIAWMQPITRAEIEEARGSSVQSRHMQQLQDWGWIASAGKRETPGRPQLWKVTSHFLDAFDLKSLEDLPKAQELKEEGFLNELNLDRIYFEESAD